jgi:starch phosphorylase
MMMEELGYSYHEARQVAAAGCVLTTHTPVAAGFDRFDAGLVDKYVGEYARSLGLTSEQFLAYGRQAPLDPCESFNMAYLASRHSSFTNGVAKLHGLVTRKMVQHMWPGYPLDEVPAEASARTWIRGERHPSGSGRGSTA